jgi:hypothetical protein
MQLTEAATLDRKSGEVEGSAVPRTFVEMFSRERSGIESAVFWTIRPTAISRRAKKKRRREMSKRDAVDHEGGCDRPCRQQKVQAE